MVALLVTLAQPASEFFSIGCELGAHRNSDGSFGAGGYAQIASTDLFGKARVRAYHTDLSNALHSLLNSVVADHEWQVQFTLSVVTAEALDGPDQIWSPLIDFNARGNNLASARESSEALIAAITIALSWLDPHAPSDGSPR